MNIYVMSISISRVKYQYMSYKYYCIDETMIIVTKKEYMSGLFCAFHTACIHNVAFSRTATTYSKSSQRGARMTEGD